MGSAALSGSFSVQDNGIIRISRTSAIIEDGQKTAVTSYRQRFVAGK
jgi:hypothetical protein